MKATNQGGQGEVRQVCRKGSDGYDQEKRNLPPRAEHYDYHSEKYAEKADNYPRKGSFKQSEGQRDNYDNYYSDRKNYEEPFREEGYYYDKGYYPESSYPQKG